MSKARVRSVHKARTRANPSWRKPGRERSAPSRVYWQWAWSSGEKGGKFSLPASIRSERDMQTNRDAVMRKVAIAADMHVPRTASLRAWLRKSGRYTRMRLPVFGHVEILPSRRSMGGGTDEIVGWSVIEDGEELGSFNLVRESTRASTELFRRSAAPRENPRSARWFHGGDDRVPPMPRLSRGDYKRLRAHANKWIGDHADSGDDLRLSTGPVFAAPDGRGGTRLWFSDDPLRSEVCYELSASTLQRRALADS